MAMEALSSEAPMAMEASSSSEEPMAAVSSEAPAASSSEEPVAAAADNKLPASALTGDVAIAAPGSTVDGSGYVGVWAKDAAGCAQIDQAGAADFAVITTSTFRDGPNACYGSFGALADGKATLAIGCASGPATVTVAQSAPDTVQINDGPVLVRCKP